MNRGTGIKIGTLFICVAIFTYLALGQSQEDVMRDESSQNMPPLRMAINFPRGSASLDPAKIAILDEYNLLDNLYSRLVERDSKGELVSAVADSFNWQGSSLVFQFSNKTRTIDGQVVGADDAARSLKRAIFFQQTGHGDIRNFLCPNVTLESIDDECEGIQVIKNTLILTPIKKNYGPHLLTMLESADFSVIPRSGLSSDPKNPFILNHRNTSGPYYVAKDDADGAWILKANSQHFNYSLKMPQLVELVPSSHQNVNQLFKSKKIDLAPTTLPLTDEFADQVENDHQNFSTHKSIPIRVLLIFFSPSALKEFTADQRFYAAKVLERALFEIFGFTDMKPTIEFLQALSDGSISESQRAVIRDLRNNSDRPTFKKRFTLLVRNENLDKWRRALSGHSEFELVGSDLTSVEIPINRRPDIYFLENDAAWTESLSLIEYNFNAHTFHLPGLNGKVWTQQYIDTEDREERILKLRELHFQLLRNAVIYPVASGPYYAFAHKPWELNFSTFSGGTELWRISYKQ